MIECMNCDEGFILCKGIDAPKGGRPTRLILSCTQCNYTSLVRSHWTQNEQGYYKHHRGPRQFWADDFFDRCYDGFPWKEIVKSQEGS